MTFRPVGWLFLALPLGIGGCDPGRSPEPRRSNVVLLVVDTLRWDHVGCYGSPRAPTPGLDALAADAVRFERAYATAPWTLPSVASMLTGRYPSDCRSTGVWGPLPDALPTLAEIFRDHGYATAGIVSHFLLGPRFRFDRGFDLFADEDAEVPDVHEHVSTENLTAKAREVLARLTEADSPPFFLLVHYFDPHYRYNRHPQYGLAPARAGRLDGTQSIAELRFGLGALSAEETDFIRSLYDEEIRHTDLGLGRLLRALREAGVWDDTIVVVTADHGEEFLERGWLGHTRTLYEELVRAPLFVRAPAAPRGRRVVTEPVSLVSLAPTVLDLAGIDPEPFGFHGPSLAAAVQGLAPPTPSPILCEATFRSAEAADVGKEVDRKAIIRDRYKLIVDRSGTMQLFDLVSDPAESRSLVERRQDVALRLAETMTRTLERMLEDVDPAPEIGLDADAASRLGSLGYIDP